MLKDKMNLDGPKETPVLVIPYHNFSVVLIVMLLMEGHLLPL